MFFLSTPITGSAMEPGTLCLTFDDGPGVTSGPGLGPRTDDLGLYLFLQGIPATFFVIGERAANHSELVAQLANWGHLIANHTEDHTWLPSLSSSEIVSQILDTEANIGTSRNPNNGFVRAPWGGWSGDVATTLNASTARDLIGPVLGEVMGADWQFWQNGQSAQDCSDDYFNKIQSFGRGIVIAHDNSFEQALSDVNNTFEMIRILVPRLLAAGYRFLRLDAVPQARSAAQVRSLVALQALPGFISPLSGGGGAVFANGPGVGAWEELGLVPLGGGQVAIRTPSGHFLSARPLSNGGEVLADGTAIYDWEVFDLEQPSTGTIALKAHHSGKYLSAPNNSQI
ncbi:MAG TPA: polysaccharide deacetylase family protein, partial [Thermoanaerobaculia bacterium]|nr:polysaccharide deacetylase family protein [Thermoanaerobaculia bacterium]